MDSITGSVVVITGPSSGNGKATALALARRGANLVLAARREDALDELARECEQAGGQAVVVPTDVTDEAQMRALAQRAMQTFGRVDAWINNAGVASFARFEDMPPEEFRRVMETNFFGYVHGARAILPIFREQGRGTRINTLSLLSLMSFPYYSAYASAKHALVGFLETLREELAGTDIHVCMLFPATMDTPLYGHAANHEGHVITPPPPIFDPQEVADAMVSLVEHPRRAAFAPPVTGRVAKALHDLSPTAFERASAFIVPRAHFGSQPMPERSGNLFEPMPGGTSIEGGWRARYRHARRMGMGGLGLAAGLVGLWRFRRRIASAR